MGIAAVIPAAGLGTRLEALTDGGSKEMLPLGGRPMIWGALSECVAADVSEIAVVVRADKADLLAWLQAAPDLGRPVTIVVQPVPVGVLDALERGRRALGAERFAVVQPDWLHLPDQTGLASLIDAADQAPGACFGLVRPTERMGRTARVDGAAPDCGRRRIEAVGPDASGPLHTGFGEVHDALWSEGLADGPPDDSRVLERLRDWAGRGLLHGLEIPGEVLDLGVPAGYQDAAERFDSGRAQWRL